MPTVANRHALGDDWPEGCIYVGRKGSLARRDVFGKHPGVVNGTALGNPFGREHGLDHYRRWLWREIKRGSRPVLDALAAINEDSILVCSCAPRACHADVVAKAWEWMQSRSDP